MACALCINVADICWYYTWMWMCLSVSLQSFSHFIYCHVDLGDFLRMRFFFRTLLFEPCVCVCVWIEQPEKKYEAFTRNDLVGKFIPRQLYCFNNESENTMKKRTNIHTWCMTIRFIFAFWFDFIAIATFSRTTLSFFRSSLKLREKKKNTNRKQEPMPNQRKKTSASQEQIYW